MPFVIGILLTPVGALIGTALFYSIFALALDAGPPNVRESAAIGFVGLVMGTMFATPVTAFVLPVSYLVLRRQSRVSVRRLTAYGAAFGFASVMILVISILWRDDGKIDSTFWGIAVLLAADGAVAGAMCGALLAHIMRRLRPADWPIAQPSPLT